MPLNVHNIPRVDELGFRPILVKNKRWNVQKVPESRINIFSIKTIPEIEDIKASLGLVLSFSVTNSARMVVCSILPLELVTGTRRALQSMLYNNIFVTYIISQPNFFGPSFLFTKHSPYPEKKGKRLVRKMIQQLRLHLTTKASNRSDKICHEPATFSVRIIW